MSVPAGLRALPLVGYMAVLFFLSSVPAGDPQRIGPDSWLSQTTQNLLHVPIFAVLGWLASWAAGGWTVNRRVQAGAAFGISAAYAVVDELHQSTVPGRFGSVTDVGLDLVGIAAGLAAFFLLRRRA